MRDRRSNGNGRGASSANGDVRRWLWSRANGVNGDRALSLEMRLEQIADRIPASDIDEIWVFPPLPDREAASEFIVLTCFDGDGRRRIVTAHVEPEDHGTAEEPDVRWVQRLREHGAAPEDWVPGLPDRLLERLSEAGMPRVLEVTGDAARWNEAVRTLTNGDGAPNGATAPHVDSDSADGHNFGGPNGSAPVDAGRSADGS